MPATSKLLTKDNIRSLPAGEYQDEKEPALRLYVSQSGTRSLGLYKWSSATISKKGTKGTPVRKSLGKVDDDTDLKAMRAKAKEWAGLLGQGGVLATAKAPTQEGADPLAFETIASQYTADRRADGNKHPAWCEDVFELHYSDWKHLRLPDLTRELVIERQNKLAQDKGPQASTRGAKALRALYKFAADQDIYDGTNFSKYAKVIESKPRKRVLKGDEHERVLAVLKDDKSLPSWVGPYFRLLLETGVRRSNLAGAEWKDFDLDAATWTIPGQKFKNGDDMRVLLTPEAVAILRDQRKRHPESPWVFPASTKRTQTGHLTDPWAGWQSVLDAAEVSGLTIHDLRRSVGSVLISRGVTLAVVAKVLGHKDSRTTERHYAHADDEAVRAALGKLVA